MAARKVVTRATTKSAVEKKTEVKAEAVKQEASTKNQAAEAKTSAKAPAKKAPAKKTPAKTQRFICSSPEERDSGQRSHGKSENNLDKRSGQSSKRSCRCKNLCKTEECAAYYVINNDVTGSFEL